jgi:hypothetical protein
MNHVEGECVSCGVFKGMSRGLTCFGVVRGLSRWKPFFCKAEACEEDEETQRCLSGA